MKNYNKFRRNASCRHVPSPRHTLCAERLLAYINWHGRKIYLDHKTYRDLRDHEGLDRCAVNDAVQDLFAYYGVVDVRISGEMQVVQALAQTLTREAA